MTTLKRIMAVVLAIMLVASIAVFSTSAAANTLKIIGKKDFVFDVYKVAAFKGETTGGYDIVATVDDSIKTYINTPGNKVAGKTFLETMDAAAEDGKNLGSKVATLQGEGAALEYSTKDAGIYYVKFVEYTGDGEAEITKNSIIVWPEYKSSNNTWDYKQTDGAYVIDLATKTSSEYVTKYFADDDDLSVASKTVAQGDVIDFVLEANVAGSTDKKLEKFEIWDKMSAGLSYNDGSIKYYYDEIKAANETSDFTMTKTNPATDTAYGTDAADSAYDKGTFFKITATSSALNGDAFYGHQKVYVTYSATVTNAAKTGSAGNPNKDGLIYKIKSGTEDKPVEGRDVTVYTASVTAKKINGTDDSPLAGATFGLYDVDNNNAKLAEGTSDANGNIVFKKNANDTKSIKLGVGKYKVAEISAPEGYAKTTATYEFEVTDASAKSDSAVFEAKDDGKAGIANYPTKLPETGGAGTTMFYIIGGCLILLAGAMFVIIMKKKASSK